MNTRTVTIPFDFFQSLLDDHYRIKFGTFVPATSPAPSAAVLPTLIRAPATGSMPADGGVEEVPPVKADLNPNTPPGYASRGAFSMPPIEGPAIKAKPKE